MALELIDTQTTDSNGEASITYTGTGAGEIEFRAKVSTLLQERYEVLDTFKYDKGLSGTGEHNDIWTGNTGSLTRYSEYSELNEGESNNKYIRTEIPKNTNLRIEFYAQANHTTNNAFRFYQNDTVVGGFGMNHFADDITSLHHCIVDIDSLGNVHVYSDESTKTTDFTLNLSSEYPLLFEFNTRQNVTSVKFKEFKVYSA